ncbi:hypothetical protein [Bartonella queenslandensis]|uniref:hypothetical protein n=1 Tax=Bartonella queenslandensis TaxID=481138 RepID=UPI001BAA95FB|nr:hypothetical protein [Bartonella queenslandensis]
MSSYKLRRFAQADVLKKIQQDNLLTFLKRYETYLTGRGFSFELNEDNELNFETLCQVLMNPSEEMNIEFVEALFFIEEMSDDDHFEELSEQAEANHIDTHENSTAADLALALWLHDPELLKRPHAEAMILKPKSFMYFQSEHKSPNTFTLPKPETIRRLEADMDAWFLKNKRGTGCRILPVSAQDEDKTYFLIRHGMPFKREGKIESGKSKMIFYRPEFHDVIVYDRANNELAVFNKSGSKKERTMYLDLFSQHLFNQAGYFSGVEKYTLQPLIDNGVDALTCADIDGLEDVKLVETQHQFMGPYNDRKTLRSNDIFASLASRDREFPNSGRLVSATFLLKFENAKRPRMVKVRTPNVANFDRKEDSHLIETWLRKRGFVNEQKEERYSMQP